MDTAKPEGAGSLTPRQEAAAVVQAWPAPAQRVLVGLASLALVLLAFHAYGSLRWATRPTKLEPGAGLAYRIDLNRADRAELLQLPGVGPSLAERIEDYRREHGAFRNVQELRGVHGIGPTILENLRPWVSVRAPSDEPEPSAKVSTPTPTRSSHSKESTLAHRIDINRASREELQRLPGIGPKLSARIVQERQQEPFRSVEDLRRVPGIGQKLLQRLLPHVTTEGAGERTVAADRS
jgi:competence ComEA-like helix-hairpin-helix protein